MKKSYKVTLVGLALAVLVSTGIALGASAIKGRPVAAAVVDVPKVFEQSKEKLALDTDLRERASQLRKEEEERSNKIKDLQKELDDKLVQPGTPAYSQKQDDYEKQALELATWRDYQTRKLQRIQVVLFESLYRKMVKTVAEVSKENGYDMVFYKESEANFQNVDPKTIALAIQGRKVVWAADDLDLTDQVVQKMNNDFKNVSATSPAPK